MKSGLEQNFYDSNDQNLKSLEAVATKRDYGEFFRQFFGSFFALGLALLLLPWQQTANGVGKVIAYSPNDRQQEISAPVDGRIAKWHVAEGDKVSVGDPIVDLTDNDPEILQKLQIERDSLGKRVLAAEKAVMTSKINVDRQRSLVSEGLSAQRALEQAQLEYTKYLMDEANASAELSRIDVRLARQMTQSVKATVSGTILSVVAGEGAQFVKSGQMLAKIVPHTASRAVELWISGNDLPLIKEGKKVRLQFEGWPALQMSGWPGAAVGTFGGKIMLIDASDNGTGYFRVVVNPEEGQHWPDSSYLRQGVRAIGWILLNEVSLGHELWRRFNGFPREMPTPMPEKQNDKKDS